MFSQLKKSVFDANLALVRHGLVVLTWGNVSGIDRERGVVAIKPSGVSYDTLTPSDIVVVRLDNGAVVDGNLRPSSDLPTHLELYRAWPEIGGVAHTHSTYATAFAQARLEIPCLGTTHADLFNGAVPLARMLTETEVAEDYETNTGRSILERFGEDASPHHFPGVLCAGHGPFTWGATPAKAVENAVALEEVARMAQLTMSLTPSPALLPAHILEKHFSRKHGAGAYYGQK
ncbi:MAG: L-ribulose-5-phosphate 4-epimerase AraD [Kiritimatiellaeota bacterium]|nr:L-ribulose-5-phosphate 4-epimerase AraD [Kiritimatiellota bacterium]